MPLPIADHALIGDCETAALGGRDGSIGSPAPFAALLGTPEHGVGRRPRSGSRTTWRSRATAPRCARSSNGFRPDGARRGSLRRSTMPSRDGAEELSSGIRPHGTHSHCAAPGAPPRPCQTQPDGIARPPRPYRVLSGSKSGVRHSSAPHAEHERSCSRSGPITGLRSTLYRRVGLSRSRADRASGSASNPDEPSITHVHLVYPEQLSHVRPDASGYKMCGGAACGHVHSTCSSGQTRRRQLERRWRRPWRSRGRIARERRD